MVVGYHSGGQSGVSRFNVVPFIGSHPILLCIPYKMWSVVPVDLMSCRGIGPDVLGQCAPRHSSNTSCLWNVYQQSSLYPASGYMRQFTQ